MAMINRVSKEPPKEDSLWTKIKNHFKNLNLYQKILYGLLVVLGVVNNALINNGTISENEPSKIVGAIGLMFILGIYFLRDKEE
tara:strand:- start:973 stop:1224 length:252 start_codon:yes stop_codon:yes gene_type:complete